MTRESPRILLVEDEAKTRASIREALEKGEVENAAKLLGYSWFASGKVIHGDKRGRELGYPTANLRLSPDCGLKYGVYAVRVSVGGQLYDAVANFGRRPMFDTGAVLLEIFLFDFSGDLYGAVLAALRTAGSSMFSLPSGSTTSCPP